LFSLNQFQHLLPQLLVFYLLVLRIRDVVLHLGSDHFNFTTQLLMLRTGLRFSQLGLTKLLIRASGESLVSLQLFVLAFNNLLQ
jgi:hypothetical protein